MAHVHGSSAAGEGHQRRLMATLALTGSVFVAEVVGAIVTGSLALLVDAGHMLTDMSVLAASAITAVLMRRRPNGVRTWGWSRLEVNGQVVYASSRLLATSMDYKEQEKITNENPEAGMHFTAASGTMKAKGGQTNLRTLPTTSEPSQVVAQLTGDATAEPSTRTGVAAV